MLKSSKKAVLVLALAMFLLVAAAVPAMAEDEVPVIPMMIIGTIEGADGSVPHDGEIIVLAGSEEVGVGDIMPGSEGVFSAFAGKKPEDFGKALSFTVVISGKEYPAQSSPAEIMSVEGGMKDNVVLKIDYKESSNTSGGSSGSNTNGTSAPAAPAASPSANTIAAGTTVSLSTTTSGASIYYTTDGTSPKDSATRKTYSEPITINADTTIKAISYNNNKYSNEVTFAYKISVTTPQEKEFSDLNGHWAAETVGGLVSKGIISGYEDNTFRPDNLITRAECSVIMARAFSLADGGQATLAAFKDAAGVPAWASGKVAAAVEAGLLNGYPEADGTKTFMPDKQVTRVELATILSRVVTQKLGAQTPAQPDFTDLSSIPAWGVEGVSIAADKGLVNGYPDGTFMPEKPVTRAEASAMIDRLLKAL